MPAVLQWHDIPINNNIATADHMTWELYVAAALLLHTGVAAYAMRSKARSVIGWRLPFLQALAGQAVITAAGAAAAGLFILAASDIGLTESGELYLLALVVLVLAWAVGLDWLTARLAQRSKGSFISPASMRRVATYTLGNLLAGYAAVGALGFMAGQLYFKQESAGSAQASATDAAKPAAPVPTPAARAGTEAPRTPLASTDAAATAGAKVKAEAAPVASAAGAAGTATAAAPTANPMATPMAAAATANERAVLEAIDAWAAAWSRRDVPAYLAAYAHDFKPADGLSRGQWEGLRRQRIMGAASIAVKVQAPVASFTDANNVTVKFRQDYQSNLTANIDAKILKLHREDNRWRIVSEQSGQ